MGGPGNSIRRCRHGFCSGCVIQKSCLQQTSMLPYGTLKGCRVVHGSVSKRRRRPKQLPLLQTPMKMPSSKSAGLDVLLQHSARDNGMPCSKTKCLIGINLSCVYDD